MTALYVAAVRTCRAARILTPGQASGLIAASLPAGRAVTSASADGDVWTVTVWDAVIMTPLTYAGRVGDYLIIPDLQVVPAPSFEQAWMLPDTDVRSDGDLRD